MVRQLQALIFVAVLSLCISMNNAEEPSGDMTEIQSLRQALASLSQQVMLQQLFAEERTRSDGDSGVKQVRHGNEGTRNYYSETHGSFRKTLSIHEHVNNKYTVGMGEFVGVLNGVEFRKRHNDYRLFMPSRIGKDYHATEPIPFPEVPPEVKKRKPLSRSRLLK